MGSALIGLAVALVGVTGTLIASVLSQRLAARVQAEQFARQERLAGAQWQRERQIVELEQRRQCYVTANSGYRRYRVELMNYLWLVHKGEVTPQGRADLEDARHAMHAAFAEAQMMASDPVLAELDAMTITLSRAYSRTMRLEEGNPRPGQSFEEIHASLAGVGDQWQAMRGAMRADLGAGPAPDGPPAVGP
ncbi:MULTISPECIES: hypothetical protein [unclassified Streptomyces]|uniref:hypothetical protein n=1 Tax=unclassified Streptomyces TaxID=2593676 RepID=UPI00288384AD|nr:hypothetical protein [Streptomyces sp. DSM 41633]